MCNFKKNFFSVNFISVRNEHFSFYNFDTTFIFIEQRHSLVQHFLEVRQFLKILGYNIGLEFSEFCNLGTIFLLNFLDDC